ncbi:hypothetical protein M5W83_03055 [Paenibacillus thiaminolyticus]|uniref:Tox-HNH-HHH domain-containing protein n=1 Tax=Paenibacillus thiaminolyticus TaxID=49283 RepID=A0AAP9J292_PANTH|nr:RHS repeat-associated core domain-containing protein [Paenibacillus thiaminolyticus]MCY9535227.1 hypothetical protein [Paenibacillus thiaminolyticus]MCY9602488.1 hypothetical protein [Paenibacillus thiaminolyticus]MCY9606140.1 hypothetical protein [Paenibacillus thiaminolyticus]MCY9612525.1 hypothetical protein [Paenibacillus thiaminolyticus]MCY9620846.1 hypothetical protein [Paenibacillus thiaminolyticus]
MDGLGDAYYYLNNQHGDVVHITNRLGGIVNSYEYDAFGHTLSATEGIPNRFRYAGEQFDPVTQQYYLRARFYNPIIARFTQEDEYRGDGLNLYAYVGNNPIRYVDPSGYSCEEKGNVYGKGENFDAIRGYRGRDLTNLPKEYLIDPRLMVEMNYKGKGASGTNSAGWERNSKKFFKELLKRNPEFWSEKNTSEIRRGRAPEVDEHFVKYFPQYMDYLEDPLRHHHIGEGGQAAALPVTLHPGYGGVHNIEKEWGITGVDDIIANRLDTLLRR